MECRVNYAHLISSPSAFLLSQKSVQSNGKNLIRVHKQFNLKEKLIEIIQILAFIIITGGIALLFSNFRAHCKQLLLKERNIFVFWDSLPEKEVLKRVQKNGLELKFASTAMQENRTIVLAAVTQNGTALRYASNLLRSDAEITQAAISQCQGAKAFVILPKATGKKAELLPMDPPQPKLNEPAPIPPAHVRIEEPPQPHLNPINEREKPKTETETKPHVAIEEKKEAPPHVHVPDKPPEVAPQLPNQPFTEADINFVLKNPLFLKPGLKMPDNLVNNREFFLKLIEKDGRAIQYGSDAIRSDKEIILKAIENIRVSFRFVKLKMPEDKDFCLKILEKIEYLEELPLQGNDYKDIVRALIPKYGILKVLLYASRLTADDDFMREDPRAYRLASEQLKNNWEYACKAYKFISFEELTPLIQSWITTHINKMKTRENDFFEGCKFLIDNEKFLLKALEVNPRVYNADPLIPFRNKIEFMVEAIHNNPKIVPLMTELKNSKDFWLAAMKKYPSLFKNAEGACAVPSPLNKDHDIILAAIKDPHVLNVANIRLPDDKIFCFEILGNNLACMNCFPDSILYNGEFMNECVQKYGLEKVLENAKKLKDTTFMYQYPQAYKHGSDTVKQNWDYACKAAYNFCTLQELHPKMAKKIEEYQAVLWWGRQDYKEAGNVLLTNEKFLLDTIRVKPEILKDGFYRGEDPFAAYKTKIDFMVEAFRLSPYLISYLGELKNQKDFWLATLKVNPSYYRDTNGDCVIPPPLNKDMDIIIASLKDPKNLDVIEDEIDDEVLLLELMKVDADAFLKAKKGLRDNPTSIVKLVEVFPNEPTFLNYLSPQLKSDESLFSNLIKHKPTALQYAAEGVQHKLKR